MRTIETAISEMLRENTGVNMLDSGGVNGRLWQHNQGIDDFKNTNVIDVEIYDKDDINISYSVYHYLTNFLSVTEQSEEFNDTLRDIIESNMYDTTHQDIQEFINGLIFRGDINESDVYEKVNTYNYDNIISTTLQYQIFEYESEYSTNTYIILQIHTGADVRGGYTAPQIFIIEDYDYYRMAQCIINAFCKCGSWYSDDCGYNWYPDNDEPLIKDISYIDDDNGSLKCSNCGKEIEFGVMENY